LPASIVIIVGVVVAKAEPLIACTEAGIQKVLSLQQSANAQSPIVINFDTV
jgi:hypothetical protein